jgi:hypothetical protein
VATTYVLLPSPLVGSATWDPVAEHLLHQGLRAVVADPGAPAHADEVLEAYVRTAAVANGEAVLVPHSNAGYYAPLVAERVATAATVYVDAALLAAEGQTTLAPPGLHSLLVTLADENGRLPPWSRWWGDDAGVLFPDSATRQRVESVMPRLPLSYFGETLDAPVGWERRRSAYLAFGDTYAEELARAEALGWPVRQLDGPHLFPLWEPATTATAIVALHQRLG